MQDTKEVKRLIRKNIRITILQNNTEEFERLIGEYKEYLPHSCYCFHKKSERKSILNLFKSCLQKGRIYFIEKLFELNNEYYMIEQENDELLRIAIQVNNVEMARKSVECGADLETVDNEHRTPLRLALKHKNLEIVCMLLYYGGYQNNTETYIADFVLAIGLRRSEMIQRILMEYITDYNYNFGGKSLLSMAITFKSNLILDLVERGADPSFTEKTINGIIISPLLAMMYDYDVDTVRELWRVFDYNEWKKAVTLAPYSPSAVLYCSIELAPLTKRKYLEVFLDNEEKLKLDIHFHESYRTSLIFDFYASCILHKVVEPLIQNCILHLLSYGASIFYSDLDFIYSRSFDKLSSFFDIVTLMDLKHVDEQARPFFTFMYFKYTIKPDVAYFLHHLRLACTSREIMLDVFRDGIKRAAALFAFDEKSKIISRQMFEYYPDIVSTMERAIYFPSLKQLAREASRNAFVIKHDIVHIRQLYDLIKVLDIPKYLKDLLTYRKNIYEIHYSFL